MEGGPKFCVLKPHRCGAWENGRHWVERGIESEEDAAAGRVRQPMLPVDRRRESAMASWDSGWAWMLRRPRTRIKQADHVPRSPRSPTMGNIHRSSLITPLHSSFSLLLDLASTFDL